MQEKGNSQCLSFKEQCDNYPVNIKMYTDPKETLPKTGGVYEDVHVHCSTTGCKNENL